MVEVATGVDFKIALKIFDLLVVSMLRIFQDYF